MKTRENSFLSIKSKLTAAVAMLLVAFFMVVSSSFAWFTLSTAPEVTGITTTVGANGNLEIALLYSKNGTDKPTDDLTALVEAIGTGFVGTNSSVTKTNTYWGNLVSLKETNNDPYGLNNIKLLPSRLNAASTTAISMTSPLAVPEYAAVGQPSTLNKGTLSGVYDNGFTDSGYGVRGIGTQSTMSQQELDWRSASQNYSSAISRAAALTNSAISGDNGQALVNIVIDYAASQTKFETHVGAVAAIITALESGLVNNLKTAQVEALKAIYAKAGESAATYVSPTDVVVTTTKDGDAYTITAKVAGKDVSEVSTYTAFTTLCQKTYDISAKLANARTELDKLYVTNDGTKTVKATVSWAEISAVLNPLFSVTAVEIGGKTYATLKQELADKGADTTLEAAEYILANCMNKDKSFTVSLKEGSGLFADVHKVTGKQVKTTAYYMQIVPVHMQTTVATPSTIDMDDLKPTVSNQNASPYLTDLYGYALDFAFRTNAKGSNLLLSEAANRIYSNSTNEETMGHGSVMKFSSSDPAFLAEDVAELMGCIRIVFTDVNGNILAVGAAETDAAGKIITTLNGDEVTAKIVLYSWELLYDTNDDNNHGKLTLGTKKTTTVDNKTVNDYTITSLSQNTATVISAYVFLDGDVTDNTKVGTGTESMTGSINLQFASDAELTPMDYADLKGQTTENN